MIVCRKANQCIFQFPWGYYKFYKKVTNTCFNKLAFKINLNGKKNRIKVNWKMSSRVTVANILRTVSLWPIRLIILTHPFRNSMRTYTIYLFDLYKNNLEEMLHMIKLWWWSYSFSESPLAVLSRHGFCSNRTPR